MQPEQDKQQEWQQPQETPSGAPFQPTAADESAPAVETPQPDVPRTEDMDQPASTEPAVDDTEDDQAVIRWQAAEHIEHERSGMWFVIFGIVVAVLMAIAWLLMRSLTFVILIPVMAATLILYVRRPPAMVDYTVSRKGIHINDKLFTYEQFKAFGVVSTDAHHSVILVPRKRFQIGQTIYFPEEVGEPLVDMLAERLPMQDVQPDAVDRLLARLRI